MRRNEGQKMNEKELIAFISSEDHSRLLDYSYQQPDTSPPQQQQQQQSQQQQQLQQQQQQQFQPQGQGRSLAIALDTHSLPPKSTIAFKSQQLPQYHQQRQQMQQQLQQFQQWRQQQSPPSQFVPELSPINSPSSPSKQRKQPQQQLPQLPASLFSPTSPLSKQQKQQIPQQWPPQQTTPPSQTSPSSPSKQLQQQQQQQPHQLLLQQQQQQQQLPLTLPSSLLPTTPSSLSSPSSRFQQPKTISYSSPSSSPKQQLSIFSTSPQQQQHRHRHGQQQQHQQISSQSKPATSKPIEKMKKFFNIKSRSSKSAERTNASRQAAKATKLFSKDRNDSDDDDDDNGGSSSSNLDVDEAGKRYHYTRRATEGGIQAPLQKLGTKLKLLETSKHKDVLLDPLQHKWTMQQKIIEVQQKEIDETKAKLKEVEEEIEKLKNLFLESEKRNEDLTAQLQQQNQLLNQQSLSPLLPLPSPPPPLPPPPQLHQQQQQQQQQKLKPQFHLNHRRTRSDGFKLVVDLDATPTSPASSNEHPSFSSNKTPPLSSSTSRIAISASPDRTQTPPKSARVARLNLIKQSALLNRATRIRTLSDCNRDQNPHLTISGYQYRPPNRLPVVYEHYETVNTETYRKMYGGRYYKKKESNIDKLLELYNARTGNSEENNIGGSRNSGGSMSVCSGGTASSSIIVERKNRFQVITRNNIDLGQSVQQQQKQQQQQQLAEQIEESKKQQQQMHSLTTSPQRPKTSPQSRQEPPTVMSQLLKKTPEKSSDLDSSGNRSSEERKKTIGLDDYLKMYNEMMRERAASRQPIRSGNASNDLPTQQLIKKRNRTVSINSESPDSKSSPQKQQQLQQQRQQQQQLQLQTRSLSLTPPTQQQAISPARHLSLTPSPGQPATSRSNILPTRKPSIRRYSCSEATFDSRRNYPFQPSRNKPTNQTKDIAERGTNNVLRKKFLDWTFRRQSAVEPPRIMPTSDSFNSSPPGSTSISSSNLSGYTSSSGSIISGLNKFGSKLAKLKFRKKNGRRQSEPTQTMNKELKGLAVKHLRNLYQKKLHECQEANFANDKLRVCIDALFVFELGHYDSRNRRSNHYIITVIIFLWFNIAPPEVAIITMLKQFECYDIMPVNSEMILLHEELKVGIRKRICSCISNLTNFIIVVVIGNDDDDNDNDYDIYNINYNNNNNDDDDDDGGDDETGNDFEIGLICADIRDSLFDAISLLKVLKFHRILVMDKNLYEPLFMLTYKKALFFIYLMFDAIHLPDYLYEPIRSMGVGTYDMDRIITIQRSTLLLDALKLLNEHHISAIPVVDDDRKLLDIFTKEDVMNLIFSDLATQMSTPIGDIVREQRERFEGLFLCNDSDQLITVIEYFIVSKVHRLLIVDQDKTLLGVVSLSDVVNFMVFGHDEEDEEDIQIGDEDDDDDDVSIQLSQSSYSIDSTSQDGVAVTSQI
ncbi:hypothetical protein HELRODRAFT_192960 [Helobdella robusta]|uniref:CBS domain-containing protein n=1 Tax=Helobdella robusta TaxID=6412 RepID=T1FUG5_HELRO|nr:hypothetical protein HELRODRAFT_192960 [Helobdella robusta]ESN98500.1 hypothetical protein HELRODRAFT_192960 [Helobdella robusta]